MSTEKFSDLFEQSTSQDLRAGDVITGKVVAISPDAVLVNVNLKSDGVVSIDEFKDSLGNVEVKVGDQVEVVVEAIEDGFGATRLSREKARRAEAWKVLEEAFENDEKIIGVIAERVKGGFTVQIESIKAFLPGSLVDVRPVRDPSYLEGKELEFKLIKMDKKRSNIVVSRRAVVEAETGAEREALIENLEEGQEITGVVKNITDYGAFVDLGGIDGLLHITDMSWKRVKHPSEIINVGDELQVKILKFDKDKRRVSLGIKQLGDDPWQNIEERYPVSMRLSGKVTNIAEYGCFVELEEGIEGLVHMSEMDWTNKNIHPAKVVQLGDEVDVMVLEIDEDRRRISLGIKQCQENPWETFSGKHEKDEIVKGQIKSITDFGVFIGLEGGIDGLVHLSDLSWTESGEEAVRNFKKGQELEAIILSIDPERERISLGIKQLHSDPINDFLTQHPKGTKVTAKISDIEQKRAIVNLGEEIQGVIKAAEVSTEQVQDVRDLFNVGDEIEARILGADRKHRTINLSLREPRGKGEQAETVTEAAPEGPKLGDLFKEQIDKD